MGVSIKAGDKCGDYGHKSTEPKYCENKKENKSEEVGFKKMFLIGLTISGKKGHRIIDCYKFNNKGKKEKAEKCLIRWMS